MRSTNPVLSKPNAFQPAQGTPTYGAPGQYGPQYGQAPYGQPQYGQPYGQQPPQPYGQPGQPAGVMTIDDVITKSALTMGVLALVAAATFVVLPLGLMLPTLIATGLLAFVSVMVVSLRRNVNPAFVMAYSVLEGIFVGALSKMVEVGFGLPGIAGQAVLATFVAAGVTFAAYKYLRIRVTGQFRKVVVIGTIALAVAYLVNFVVSLFGANLGLVGWGASAGPLAWLVSAVAVVLAVANLIMDFDYIEQGVRNRAPASESWRAAFGLTVTMVWLYTELLRILSYFRSN